MLPPIQAAFLDQNGRITQPWVAWIQFISVGAFLVVSLSDLAVLDEYSLSTVESSRVVTNKDCTAIQTVNLPAATIGLEYRFTEVAGFAIHAKPQSTDTIVGASAAGKYLSLDVLGSSAYLRCIVDGTWAILSSHGTTSYEP